MTNLRVSKHFWRYFFAPCVPDTLQMYRTMYLHPVFYISLLSLSPSITLANPQPPLQPLVTYSTWMLESIISRQQGIANSGAATGQIELGIFQDALQQIIFWKGIPDSTQTEQWSDYLDRSVRSGLSSLLNATRDALYPLDRLSLGNALLHLYGQRYLMKYCSRTCFQLIL